MISIIIFDNMAKTIVTYSKSKVNVSNDQKIQDCLLTRIVHIPSPETVLISSDVTQIKYLSAKKALYIHLIKMHC